VNRVRPTPLSDRLTWRGEHPLGPAARRTFAEAVPYCLGPASDGWSLGFDPSGVPHVKADVGRERVAVVEPCLAEAFAQASMVRDGGPATPLAAVVPARAPRDEPGPGMFRQVGPGLIVGSPAAVAAIGTIDRWLTRLFARFEPVELAVPGLVSTEVLERSGYLSSLPHHVTGCSTVDFRIEAVRAVSAGGIAALQHPDVRSAPVALPPAACHHVYAYLADQVAGDPVVYGLRACCARHEPAGFGPYRLWSFQQREFVHVGTAEGARRFVAEVLALLSDVVATSSPLRCRLASASDPFFVARAAAGATFQSFAGTKHELLAVTPGGDEVALGSVNLHRSYFGRRFGIRTAAGDPVHTACAGFGLERMAAVLAGWLGPDPGAWPQLAVPG
jgi:hypothetical protein